MNFEIDKEIVKRQMAFREFLEAEIRDDGNERDPGGPLSDKEIRDYFKRLQPSDIMRASLPEDVGGTNRSFLERILLAEEFARVWPSLAGTVDTHNIVVELIARQGKPWMKAKYVPGGIAGTLIMGDMMSEPEAGSDTRNLKTTAVLKDGYYAVNGQKMWTTNGPWADLAILTAVIDMDSYKQKSNRGVIHLLIDKTVCDWKVRDLPLVGGKAGTTGHSVFTNCMVPEKYLFHGEGDGYRQNFVVRGWARVLLGGWAIGMMQAALEDAIRFARERRTYGKAIAGHQMIQDLIANMVVDIETSRLLTYKAACMMDRNIRCDQEQAMAKLHACEAAQRVTSNAIQILGGRGLTTEEGYFTERYFRDARPLTIAEGTSQIMKLIIGRQTLGVSAVS